MSEVPDVQLGQLILVRGNEAIYLQNLSCQEKHSRVRLCPRRRQ